MMEIQLGLGRELEFQISILLLCDRSLVEYEMTGQSRFRFAMKLEPSRLYSCTVASHLSAAMLPYAA